MIHPLLRSRRRTFPGPQKLHHAPVSLNRSYLHLPPSRHEHTEWLLLGLLSSSVNSVFRLLWLFFKQQLNHVVYISDPGFICSTLWNASMLLCVALELLFSFLIRNVWQLTVWIYQNLLANPVMNFWVVSYSWSSVTNSLCVSSGRT